ncbi:phosphatidylinositol-3,5-bisphosphate 3-phosphatase MTMR14-like [Porites lutea]|uniref:phosphatidylinositol-3,5-bisphosphate 3-phosphatase MTMR14-like n=1 Tax=Porites lutea TaxID=51062 RepID=UPI003CC5F233
MSLDEEVSRTELFELVKYFSKYPYRARDTNPKVEGIQKKCLQLFAKDYKFTTVTNNGDLCGHYPLKLVILESKLTNDLENVDSPKANDAKKLKDLFVKARFARCRSRFVVPVILFEGKNICRSATLSGGAEIYGRSGYDFLFAGGESIPDDPLEDINGVNNSAGSLYSSGDYDLFDRIRGQDIRLLKTLRVKYICDLMVEKKKVKFGMRVTSSEKVDKIQRYSDFVLCSVPYPGCEFFRDFKDNEYIADGLHFNWQQDYVDTKFNVPDLLLDRSGIEWNNYQSWDLVTLTQNYLHLLISCIKDGEGGLLIHCISGWDRTPLFVSLLRMSLWADGRIHQSLSAVEVLFLTVAYDWFLFGHSLPERLQRGEEVFFFCFNFLKNIASDDYSVNTLSRRASAKRSDSVGQLDVGAVLLDDRVSRGSNSSLSSCSSVSEQRGFFIGQEITEDAEMSSSSFTYGARAAYHSPPHSHSTGYEYECRHQSTSPLPVPRRSRKNSNPYDQKPSSSSVCGSWQLISGTGSPNGTTSMRDSPISTLDHGSSTTSLAESVDECSDRQKRLGDIRSLFLHVFFKAVDCGNKFEGGTSFASIFDQVTEKIREGWGTVV